MARLPRFVIPGQPQHLIQRGNNRQAIFAADTDYEFFRDALVEAAIKHGLAIHAYVWMTNHIHLLASPESGQAISKTFQSVGRRHVQHFNATYPGSKKATFVPFFVFSGCIDVLPGVSAKRTGGTLIARNRGAPSCRRQGFNG